MRKYFKMLCVFSVIVLATGCIKMDVSMKINKDKSVVFKFTEAMANSLIQSKGSDSILSKSDIAKMKKEGFTVENYSKDNMTGFTLSKKFKSIDEISDTKNVKGDLSLKKSGDKMFTVKKGLFKNTYTAKFKSSDTSSVNSQMSSSSSSYLSSMDMKFKITLPYKAISNNATKVSKDGKTLTWDLLKHKGNIEFKFNLYNMTIIYIAIGAGILLIGGAVAVVIVVLNKKKNTQKTEE